MDARNIFMAISLVLSVLIGLVVGRGTGAAAGPAGKNAGPPMIGLSLDTLKEARWQGDRDYFVAQAKKLGATVSVNAANSDDSQQARDVQSLLAAGVNALVIVPHDGVAMAKGVGQAKQAGVPVIAYDRMIKDCDLDLYVSFDNVRIGHQQAQFLVDHLPTPGKGRIVRICGAKTDNNAHLFKQGQDEVLDPLVKSGAIVMVRDDWAEDWKPENAKRIVNAAITDGGSFDGVLASNDGTAGGAIQALSEAGLTGKVVVTGQDAELAACQRIAAGTQSMTIFKPLRQLATIAADDAVALATGKSVVATAAVNNGQKDVPAVLLDTVVVTKDNLLDTVVKEGFHTYDDIYAPLPEAMRPPKPKA